MCSFDYLCLYNIYIDLYINPVFVSYDLLYVVKEYLPISNFQKLQVLVAREQEECQTYLKQLALHNPYLYTSLSPHVAKYTQVSLTCNQWHAATPTFIIIPTCFHALRNMHMIMII